MELADRIVVMRAGRIEQEGGPDEIYERPATPFVFDFVGQSIRLPVTVAGGRVKLGDTVVATADATAPAGKALLFARPDDVRIEGPGATGIPGEVRSVRRAAGHRLVEVALGPEGHLAEVAVRGGPPFGPGEPVTVAVSAFRLYAE